MDIKAGSQTILVRSIYEEDLYLSGGARRALRLELVGPLTGEQAAAIASGSITLEDGRVYAGYDTVHACHVVLLARDDREALQDNLQALAAVASAALTDEQALGLPDVWPQWEAAKSYAAGNVVRHNNALYRVEQAHTSQVHQPPDGAGMLAVYRPIQPEAKPGEVLPWVSGEAGIKVGDKRTHNGVVYEAIQNPGANIWTPDAVPAIWKKAE